MTVSYNTNVINSRLTVVLNAIDAGSGSGKLLIGTTGMAVTLSTITLSKPCGTISAGVLTFSGVPLTDGFAANTGTASAAEITDSAGTVIASGLTVGTAGTDMIISTTSITQGDIVSLTVATITGT